MHALPTFTPSTRWMRARMIAWVIGLLVTLACALAPTSLQALGEHAPSALEGTTLEATSTGPANSPEPEKDTLDREGVLLDAPQLTPRLSTATSNTERALRPQFQAPPPQRPPRASA